jgi:cytochrome d ubiquinol oxidase subunit II
MVELWFGIVAVMLAAYVVLDGFDLGAGTLHLIVARNDSERRQVLAAIGPYWDGNEVWLLALGGALFVAFPQVLASSLSGFYFAIFLVLWGLVLRGIAIEFRSHVEHRVWRDAWDVVFAVASMALPVLFGAAFGNLLRGVPLDESGWFTLTLFTDFTARHPVGILDWYTVLAGVFALAALAAHGAVFLGWKTDGVVQARATALGRVLYAAVAVSWPLLTWGTSIVRPDLFPQMMARPLAIVSALVAIVGLGAVAFGLLRARPLVSFGGSCAFLAGVLAATAASTFPVMLRATGADTLSVTAYGASSGDGNLRTALGWWIVGAPLAVLYFVLVFRLHRGPARAAVGREGY